MDKLYPIVRRVRRPLLVAESEPTLAAPVQPLAVTPTVESTAAVSAPEKPKADDAESLSHDAAE
jgi:hypothetical protein